MDAKGRIIAVAACCVTTLVAVAGPVETMANCEQAIPSGYVLPVERSAADLELRLASSETGISDAARFRLLADDWRQYTRYRSNITRAVLHPSHIAIVRMKEEVVLPMILAELRDRGGHWFWALETLSKQTVGAPGDSLTMIKAKWLEWGRTNGLLA